MFGQILKWLVKSEHVGYSKVHGPPTGEAHTHKGVPPMQQGEGGWQRVDRFATSGEIGNELTDCDGLTDWQRVDRLATSVHDLRDS